MKFDSLNYHKRVVITDGGATERATRNPTPTVPLRRQLLRFLDDGGGGRGGPRKTSHEVINA